MASSNVSSFIQRVGQGVKPNMFMVDVNFPGSLSKSADDLETTKFLYYYIIDMQDFNTIEISAKTDSVIGFEWD